MNEAELGGTLVLMILAILLDLQCYRFVVWFVGCKPERWYAKIIANFGSIVLTFVGLLVIFFMIDGIAKIFGS